MSYRAKMLMLSSCRGKVELVYSSPITIMSGILLGYQVNSISSMTVETLDYDEVIVRGNQLRLTSNLVRTGGGDVLFFASPVKYNSYKLFVNGIKASSEQCRIIKELKPARPLKEGVKQIRSYRVDRMLSVAVNRQRVS